MAIKFPDGTSAPKAQVGLRPKPARLRGLSALPGGKRFPPHFTPQPGPILCDWRPFPWPLKPGSRPPELGAPLTIDEVASLIGCSPWTVRQTLIPRGLPHFRFTASGRLIFYRDQVIRWIENQQQGGKTTL